MDGHCLFQQKYKQTVCFNKLTRFCEQIYKFTQRNFSILSAERISL